MNCFAAACLFLPDVSGISSGLLKIIGPNLLAPRVERKRLNNQAVWPIMPTIRDLVAISTFTRTYAVVPLQTFDQRSGGPLNCG